MNRECNQGKARQLKLSERIGAVGATLTIIGEVLAIIEKIEKIEATEEVKVQQQIDYLQRQIDELKAERLKDEW